MSVNITGGIDYNKILTTFLCSDACTLRVDGVTYLNGVPFTATQTYYTSGLMAYLNDTDVIDVEKGWTTFTHGQPAVPAWLSPFLTTLGVGWPAVVPAFEAKDTLMYSTEDCWIAFDGTDRVPEFVPANTFMRFKRRWFILFVVRDSDSGNLRLWIEG